MTDKLSLLEQLEQQTQGRLATKSAWLSASGDAPVTEEDLSLALKILEGAKGRKIFGLVLAVMVEPVGDNAGDGVDSQVAILGDSDITQETTNLLGLVNLKEAYKEAERRAENCPCPGCTARRAAVNGRVSDVISRMAH